MFSRAKAARMHFRSGVRFPFRASVALVLVLLNGCSSWKTHSQGPESLLAKKYPPSRIEVFTSGSKPFKIKQPRIVGDSLMGVHKDTTVTVALSDVSRVKHKRLSWWKTSVVFLGTMLLAAGIAVGVSMQ